MPTISVFMGITITMYFEETPHHQPHFHARYGEHKASFALSGEVLAGKLPRRQLRLVQSWVELHLDELATDWRLAVDEQPLNPIPPLA